MKLFTKDAKEWKELKKEFNQTLIGKTIKSIDYTLLIFVALFAVAIIYYIFTLDLVGEEFQVELVLNILILGFIECVFKAINTFAYNFFLAKYVESKK